MHDIPTEQNSPKVIERARAQMAKAREAQDERPNDASHCHGRSMRVGGYLSALMIEDLISNGQYMQLLSEWEAVDRMTALASAPKAE
ncbi:hypothetical protein C4K04_2718 [Pseudomonas chlororaphis]|uniref:Uncharacterized protein n=1 Tax=Pseudomonas chlororaphis TaxID=587753 RepID=A0A3G7TMX9_9PSED|nr:hypothetical protein [Pseudomonas chlororaphis]AZE48390.1 hypothetical protein C4K04_2718 [Pseudomonas chlororaphis]